MWNLMSSEPWAPRDRLLTASGVVCRHLYQRENFPVVFFRNCRPVHFEVEELVRDTEAAATENITFFLCIVHDSRRCHAWWTSFRLFWLRRLLDNFLVLWETRYAEHADVGNLLSLLFNLLLLLRISREVRATILFCFTVLFTQE